MNENREFSTDRAIRFRKRFPAVVELIADNLDRPFRPRNVINSAMLEGVMIALLEDENISGPQLKERYNKLANDPNFEKYLRGPTTDTLIVRERIKRAKEVLSHGKD